MNVPTRIVGVALAGAVTALAVWAMPRSEGRTEAQGDVPRINGVVTSLSSWTDASAAQGFYSIPTDDTMDFELLYKAGDIYYSGCSTPDFYAAFGLEGGYPYYVAYDLNTGNRIVKSQCSALTEVAIDMTYDPIARTVYGLSYTANGESSALARYTFTRSGYTKQIVANMKGQWNAIASDKSGNLYAISSDGYLHTVNKSTGATAQIGYTGYTPQGMGSAVFDENSGRMFWTTTGGNGAFISEINITNGTATVLKNFGQGDKIVGLYVPGPEARDKAPAAATNLKASFEGGSLTGTFTFDAPTTLFDGSSASGAITYTLKSDNEVVATGSTTFGAKNVSISYTAPKAGEYKFYLTLSNAVGESPRALLRTFIGYGTPKAPASVTSSYNIATKKVDVSWLPVTEAVDGGYIEASKVTYTVTRNDGTVVARDITATSCSDDVVTTGGIDTFSYTVTAAYQGNTSAGTKSNDVVIGSVTPPYTNDFTSDLGDFEPLNVNGDGYTWKWSNLYGGTARVRYNQFKPMDDWLFTVPFNLKKGYVYQLTFRAWGTDTTDETIEVKYGKERSVAGMTHTLVDKVSVWGPESESSKFDVSLSPDEDGIYFIGFHGCSDQSRFYLYLDDVSLSGGLTQDGPNPVSDLKAVAGTGTERSVTLSFKAPDKTMSGAALDAIDRIEIKRGDLLVHTIQNPAPGASLNYKDMPEKSGYYEYSVTVFTATGESQAEKITCFCGHNVPKAPARAEVKEDATQGNITVSWTAVTQDINNNPFGNGGVKYVVEQYDGLDWVVKGKDITGTSYSYTAVTGNNQEFAQCRVYAVGESGNGEAVEAGPVPVGRPYTDVYETFEDGQYNYIWGVIDNGAVWTPTRYTQLTNVPSCDNDGYMLVSRGTAIDDCAELYSGKIDLSAMSRPGITFYAFNNNGSNPNVMKIWARVAGDSDWQEVFSDAINEVAPGEDGWVMISAPLTDYEGKTIQVKIGSVVKNFPQTMIDDIKIGDVFGRDLAAGGISAPSQVITGRNYEVVLSVRNEGTSQASGYTLEIRCDDEVIASMPGEPIISGQTIECTIPMKMSALATKTMNCTASIVWANDLNQNNNSFPRFSITPVLTKLPRAVNLQGKEEKPGEITLTWGEPDVNAIVGETITYNFEDGEPGSFTYPGWTFIDGDGQPLGGIGDENGLYNIPGVVTGKTTGSFLIIDSELLDYGTLFHPYSGTKYLASLRRNDSGKCDDWAITPELTGLKQTVSLYARSYFNSEPESMRLMYSTGSLKPEDFIELKNISAVPVAWTKYEVDLPEGAKYFAINGTSDNGWLLMVDDVTCTPRGGAAGPVTLLGYNIYRDSEVLNAEPVTERRYVDADFESGEHSYMVTAVYKEGESTPTDVVKISEVTELDYGMSVETMPGLITVRGADDRNVVITAADGRNVWVGTGDCRVSVAGGVYIVRIGEKVVKVRVG